MDKEESGQQVPVARNIPMERPDDKPFSISSINYRLYQGLSKRFGIGAEVRDQDQNRLILVRHLDPDDPLIGFQGKIRFIAAYGLTGLTHFELYSNIHHDDPELELVGGARYGGVQSCLDGGLMVEKLNANFHPTRGLDLQSPATLLIGRIIEAAGELAKNPKCTCDKYWTAERY